MTTQRPGAEFIAEMRALQDVYLTGDDPTAQSGFSGGRERWVAERSPVAMAFDRDGDILDVGCANGLLLEDITAWAAEKGHTIVPYGVDIGSELVERARARMPRFAANLHVHDAWDWEPGRTWDYVYSLEDLAPVELKCEWIRRLAGWVTPGGRLIIGSYGSRSRGIDPVDVGVCLERCGLDVAGTATGGEPPVSRFAWADV